MGESRDNAPLTKQVFAENGFAEHSVPLDDGGIHYYYRKKYDDIMLEIDTTTVCLGHHTFDLVELPKKCNTVQDLKLLLHVVFGEEM